MRTLLLALFIGPAQVLFAQPSGQRYTAEEYIALWKPVALEKMKQHGIPASITLAQGLLESGNGNSELAREGNNHFGIKCTPDWTGGKVYHDDDKKDDCFRKYKNAEQSFEDHSNFLRRKRYAGLFELKITDYRGWAKGLKAAGYATDPKYPEKLINLIEKYELNRLDEGKEWAYNKSASEPKEPAKSSGRKGRAKEDASNTVTIGAGRAVDKFEGRIKYVVAKKGDTVRKIAEDIEQMPGLVAGWNDLSKDSPLSEGQRVYIQPKRNKSKSAEVHRAEAGETLWGVSQRYGVKLKKLAQYNQLPEDARLQAGQQVWLRKPRK
ncbi:MAG TPA: glucosaminidase domain-containing protein [Flavobacteriales bacterium]